MSLPIQNKKFRNLIPSELDEHLPVIFCLAEEIPSKKTKHVAFVKDKALTFIKQEGFVLRTVISLYRRSLYMEDNIFLLFSECVPVMGAENAIICDLGRNRYQYITDGLYEILTDYSNKTLQEIKAVYQHQYDEIIDEYFNFLMKHEFGMWIDKEDRLRFPSINFNYESPAVLDNAIIDFNKDSGHDLDNICSQLDELGCRYLQIRCFDLIDKGKIKEWIKIIFHHRFLSSEWIIKYHPDYTVEDYTGFYLYQSDVFKFIVHSTPDSFYKSEMFEKLNEIGQGFYFVRDRITDESHCGIIHPLNFSINILSFSEAKNFNSCLYKKIGIDTKGNIKNCPSLESNFGNISAVSIKEAIRYQDYFKIGLITKDQIEICKDCEFRYICTDCRAYIPQNMQDNGLYPKPKKCNYDPYSSTWK